MSDPELLRETRDVLLTTQERLDSESAERLDPIVSRIESALEAERTLDHGNLANFQNTLRELTEETDEQSIKTVRSLLSEYREGVEGV